MGVGQDWGQVASKQSERATCRGYCSCCTVLLLYCSLLHYKSVMSGFLSILGGPTFKLGGPTFKLGGPTFEWGEPNFLGEPRAYGTLKSSYNQQCTFVGKHFASSWLMAQPSSKLNCWPDLSHTNEPYLAMVTTSASNKGG